MANFVVAGGKLYYQRDIKENKMETYEFVNPDLPSMIEFGIDETQARMLLLAMENSKPKVIVPDEYRYKHCLLWRNHVMASFDTKEDMEIAKKDPNIYNPHIMYIEYHPNK